MIPRYPEATFKPDISECFGFKGKEIAQLTVVYGRMYKNRKYNGIGRGAIRKQGATKNSPPFLFLLSNSFQETFTHSTHPLETVINYEELELVRDEAL